MTRQRDWTLDSDDAAGGVTLNSDTITLGGRLLYFVNEKVAKPTAVFTKGAKPAATWTKTELNPIINP